MIQTQRAVNDQYKDIHGHMQLLRVAGEKTLEEQDTMILNLEARKLDAREGHWFCLVSLFNSVFEFKIQRDWASGNPGFRDK